MFQPLLAADLRAGRRAARVALSLAAALAGPASAGPPPARPLPWPAETDTLAASGFSRTELAPILAQVAATSFDAPDAWSAELRMRRATLGGGAYLLIRGSDLLCGGTGGCEAWLFAKRHGRWTSLIGGQAPVVDGLSVTAHLSHGQPDLVAAAHVSAGRSRYAVLAFDGQVYRTARCYESGVTGAGAPGPGARAVACEPAETR